MWINQSFLLDTDVVANGNQLEIAFLSQRTGTPLFIIMDAQSHMNVLTDSMDLAGDIFQSLIAYLNIEDLESQADFPRDMDEMREILTKVSFYRWQYPEVVVSLLYHCSLPTHQGIDAIAI